MKTIAFHLLTFSSLSFSAMKPVTLSDGSVERLGLALEVPQIQAISDPVRATGRLTLDPLATAIVSSPVTGKIEEDFFPRGSEVKAGDRLLTLRSAERAAAITDYLQSEQVYHFAQSAYQRESDLAKRKLTTTEALREREQALAAARTGHLAALQNIYLLEISEQRLHAMLNEDLVRENLSQHILTAPIDGIIIDKMTSPGAPVERNAELLKLAVLDHLLVEFQVPLRAVPRVRVGESVSFHPIVGSAREGTAAVTGLVPVADHATLVATAMARLENPNRQWIAGTPVEILLADPEAPLLPAVPIGSVIEIDGTPCVFLAQGGETFLPYPIEVAAKSGELLGLRGLPEGEPRVVTQGASLLLAAWEEAQSAN